MSEQKKSGFLILQVKPGSWLKLGDRGDRIAVKEIRRGSVRLVFNAPNLRVTREEVQSGTEEPKREES